MAEGSWIRIGAVKAGLDARTVNSIIKEAVGKRLTSITQAPDVRQAIGEEFIRQVTPLVPMKTGRLRESGRATDDGRVYWTAVKPAWGEDGYDFNYAETVYDPDGVRWPDGAYKKPTTTGTVPRWVEQMKPGTPEYEAFINGVRQIIIDAHNKGLI